MDTQKLRQRILDLAIRGKLVPQDPNDEPASVLLDRIRAEKECLIAEGKIKRPKAKKSTDKSHYQQFTPPFDIPASWEWVRLEDICFAITDGDHQAPSKVNDGIPFLVISDIITGIIKFDKCRYVPFEYYSNLETYRQPSTGDILFTVTGSYGKSVIVETDKRFCFQRHIGLIKPILITKYLNIVLCSKYIKKECDAKATGTAQKTVGLESLRNFYIPIPPLSEQSRIIEQCQICEELLIKIDEGKKILGALIEASKSKILDLAMQGKLVPQDPADEPAADMLRRINPKAKIITDNPHYPQLPDNWVYMSLSAINTYKSSTVTPSSMPEQLFDLYSVPIFSTLKPENIQGGEIGSAKQVINKGDVLLCKINPHLNRVWEIIEESDNIQIASSEWIVVRSKFHHPTFLKWYFNSPKFRTLLSSQVSGVGGSLTRAQPAIVKSYPVPIPPMEEQKRISSAIELWFNSLDSINLSLTN